MLRECLGNAWGTEFNLLDVINNQTMQKILSGLLTIALLTSCSAVGKRSNFEKPLSKTDVMQEIVQKVRQRENNKAY